MKVDKQLIEQIGSVMKLKFTDNDIKKYSSDIQETLDMLEKLDELNTEGVEPTFYGGLKGEAVFRKDIALRNEKEVEALLENTPMTAETSIKVPVILDDGEGGA